MKSFAPKPWFAPQPVLIIGTYNKDGVANAMNAAWAGQWDMKEIMISMGKPRHHRQPEAWRRVYRCLRYQENHGGF